MPHCTTNFAWYLGKFIAGFTGMLFFYVVFLKEREYNCLCKARMREFLRRKGENTNSCPLEDQADASASTALEPKSMLAGVQNVWAWYTKVREWFLEKDPTIISETALALGRSLPKNDNDVSSVNCMCCVTLLNRKTKRTESTTSVRKKRQGRHCLFRHCSGLVCAKKLMKRRKNRQACVHLRVSQDTISDYWKVCQSMHDRNDINNKQMREGDTNVKQKTVEAINEHKGEIVDECCRNVKDKGKEEDTSKKDDVPFRLCTNEKDSELKATLKSPCVCANESCSDCNISQLSLRTTEEVKCKEEKLNNSKNVGNNKIKLSPIPVDEGTANSLKKKSKIDTPKDPLSEISNKKCSQSETSFGETISTDNCVDSILYRELQNKCAPSVATELSKRYLQVDKIIESKFTTKSKEENSRREENVDKIMDYFLDDVQTFSSGQRQRYNLKHPINKHQSTSRLQAKFHNRNIEVSSDVQQRSAFLVGWHKNTANQKKLPSFPCQNCCCDTKARNHDESQRSRKQLSSSQLRANNSPFQSQYKILPTNVQSQRKDYPCECVRSKQKIDSVPDRKFPPSPHEIRSPKFQSQLQYKEKPTLVIYKNRKSNRSGKSTNSVYSSSSSSIETVERSVYRDNSVTCRCSPYASSRTIPSSGRYKYNKSNTNMASLLSSSSSLSSAKRRHSSAMISQNSVHRRQEAISSSSCTNVSKWRRHIGKERRTSTCLSSTSCSCSLSSLSTFRDSSLEESDRDSRPTPILRRKPKFYEQKKKRIAYADERRIRWNVKNMY